MADDTTINITLHDDGGEPSRPSRFPKAGTPEAEAYNEARRGYRARQKAVQEAGGESAYIKNVREDFTRWREVGKKSWEEGQKAKGEAEKEAEQSARDQAKEAARSARDAQREFAEWRRQGRKQWEEEQKQKEKEKKLHDKAAEQAWRNTPDQIKDPSKYAARQAKMESVLNDKRLREKYRKDSKFLNWIGHLATSWGGKRFGTLGGALFGQGIRYAAQGVMRRFRGGGGAGGGRGGGGGGAVAGGAGGPGGGLRGLMTARNAVLATGVGATLLLVAAVRSLSREVASWHGKLLPLSGRMQEAEQAKEIMKGQAYMRRLDRVGETLAATTEAEGAVDAWWEGVKTGIGAPLVEFKRMVMETLADLVSWLSRYNYREEIKETRKEFFDFFDPNEASRFAPPTTKDAPTGHGSIF